MSWFTKKVAPKAWNIADGTELPIELIANEIKPILGSYVSTFKATREDSSTNIQKNSDIVVGGVLKFKEVPENLDYKSAKINQKIQYIERKQPNWNMSLENTIGSNWSLFASVTPFENQSKDKLNSSLVYKNEKMEEVAINDTSQKIATGNETYSTIQWAESAGMLLKVNPDAKIGRYQGEINWVLSDAP